MTKTVFLLTLTALTSIRALWLGIIALGLAWTATAQAQSEPTIFLKWPGIVGFSKVPGYAGSIELTSYSQSFSNTPGNPFVCGAVTIIKHVDSTSPDFIQMLLSGVGTIKTIDGPVTITFVKQSTAFYTVSLKGIRLTGITQSDTSATSITSSTTATLEPPIETITLSATQLVFTSNGAQFGWDCSTNAKL
jgi:type VI protein secretion system component Hcp